MRLVAFFTLSLMVAGLFSSLKWVALFLCLDFFVRGFTDWPVSPLRALAKSIVKTLHLPPKMINAGPKIFAARIGCIFTALIASGYSNLMDYLQTLFGFFNAPLFATFLLGMFWKRMTATAGWTGLVAGTLSAVVVFILSEVGVINLPGQGMPFVAASAAFVVDILVSVVVTMVTAPKPAKELVGLVYSETPKSHFTDPADAGASWYARPVPLAGMALVLVIALNIVFH